MGEWVFPVLVLGGGALVLIAARRQAPRGRRPCEPAHANERRRSVRVALGLVSFVALLNLAGFVAAGTVLFACTASAFGSRRWLRDALVGLTLCAAVYITFTHGLGVPLPPGLFLAER